MVRISWSSHLPKFALLPLAAPDFFFRYHPSYRCAPPCGLWWHLPRSFPSRFPDRADTRRRVQGPPYSVYQHGDCRRWCGSRWCVLDSRCRGKIECSPPRFRCCYSRERLVRVRRPPSRGKELKKSRALPQIHRVSLWHKTCDPHPPLLGCHRVKKRSIHFPDALRSKPSAVLTTWKLASRVAHPCGFCKGGLFGGS